MEGREAAVMYGNVMEQGYFEICRSFGRDAQRPKALTQETTSLGLDGWITVGVR